MKRCPSCNATYNDEALLFCTTDGTALVSSASGGNDAATRVFQDPPATVFMPPPTPTDYGPMAQANRPRTPPPYGWANDSAPQWTPPPAPSPYVGFAPGQTQNGLAITSLVFGLLGMSIGWLCGGWFFAIVGLATGAGAMVQVRKNPAQYGGMPMALIGTILSGLVLLIHLGLLLLFIFAAIFSH